MYRSIHLFIMKKIFVILVVVLAVSTTTVGYLYANNILRTTQYFKDDVGGQLHLLSSGYYKLTIVVNNKSSFKQEKYDLVGSTVKLYNSDGAVFMSCPFQWETQGIKIKWVQVDGIKMYRFGD